MMDLILCPGVPALLVERTLVLADLHLGVSGLRDYEGLKELTTELFARIAKLAEETKAKNLVLAGDIKEPITHVPRLLKNCLTPALEMLTSYVDEVIICRGNHDGRLEDALPSGVSFLDVLELHTCTITHGHAKISDPPKLLISAHIHPVYLVRAKTYSVLTKCWIIAEVECDEGKFTWICVPAFSRVWGLRIDTLPAQKLLEMIPMRGIKNIRAKLLSLDLLLLDSLEYVRRERS